ncbi:GNAT family N-acetyltransferase [Variovorax sp. J22G73]|uniref:GNAT family N-acetyltransferase n=1 Tax=unclassified Variovorax TaxID=663243 RepID=UPI0025767757|nr:MULTISPECIES: GNAT family N-acetyltransferase [unclassified Variovorax]MDM0006434.1 GNAT family N-acetyltransferase [Variovorax sp. J22R203]MDM0097543.1 GNAT family N-acetyltransferase [Variovorax sp. J22G73]
MDEHEDYLVGAWWIVWDGKEPVAFCGYRAAVTEPNTAYLSRCGVLASHRGRGIQKKLLQVRLRRIKALRFNSAISTTYLNTVSANNLIRAGFRLYDPRAPWGSPGTCYWRKEFP